jgi:mannose-6-phosphate isomerase-like protein (cupin superfamily)
MDAPNPDPQPAPDATPDPRPAPDPSPDPEASPSPGASPVRAVDLRDYVDFAQGRATRVRVHATATIALDVWCIEPQQSTPVLHLEDRDVVYTVVGGRSWFVTDEGEIGLDPMGSMLVPAGTVHGIDNRAPDPLIVLAASSPPGSDPVADPVELAEEAVRREPPGPGPVRRAWERVLGR